LPAPKLSNVEAGFYVGLFQKQFQKALFKELTKNSAPIEVYAHFDNMTGIGLNPNKMQIDLS